MIIVEILLWIALGIIGLIILGITIYSAGRIFIKGVIDEVVLIITKEQKENGKED